ncbi:MAG: hydroxymethylbilane synthase [Gammaproteobacteria bacterium]|nr:hydroxymethylbilane synthase [Gammaproteobacteria bacterium]
MTERIRIGTRKSDLAMWQAMYVRDGLIDAHSDLDVELVGITTEGDRTLDVPLAEKGGKGLFLKELERALIEHRIDIAVHSMKDVTVTEPDGLHIPVICERESPYDALVSGNFASLKELPAGARVGTCSLRRQAILRNQFPQLEVDNLRGNVNRRLERLDSGDFDAIILASAGLIRLKMRDRIREVIPAEVMLPAVGQGAVGIQCRIQDERVERLIAPLNHQPSACRVLAERSANARLGGGCHVPVGAFAELSDARLRLRGFVGSPDGSKAVYAELEGGSEHAEALGAKLAESLLNEGAGDILKSFAHA